MSLQNNAFLFLSLLCFTINIRTLTFLKHFFLICLVCVIFRVYYRSNICAPSKFHILKPTHKVIVFGRSVFGGWLGDGGEVLMSGITCPCEGNPRELLCCFHHMRSQQEDAYLWTRKQFFTGCQICEHPDLLLPSLQNCEKNSISYLSHPNYGIFITVAWRD